MTSLDYYLWSAVKDKCYADKPEAIEALKHNICEAIGELQLHTIVSGIGALKRTILMKLLVHTIDNVLKNLSDRVGYCMASRGSHLNVIICHY